VGQYVTVADEAVNGRPAAEACGTVQVAVSDGDRRRSGRYDCWRHPSSETCFRAR
jgi:hypothetical protein